jgi:hypothetical protein
MSDDIAAAAAYFLSVCREHHREFPLRNILVVTDGYRAVEDKDRFVVDVWSFLEAEKRNFAGENQRRQHPEHTIDVRNLL